MNEKEEYPSGRNNDFSSEPSANDWTDSNEQEQKKWECSANPAQTPTEAERSASPSSDSRRSQKRLPVRAPSSSRSLTKNTAKIPATVASSKPVFLPNANQEKKVPRSARRSRFLRIWIPTSLLLALLVSVGTLTISYRWMHSDKTVPSDPTESITNDVPSAEDSKIVFVRPYDDQSGLLTAAELYEKCADAVVSVLTDSSSSSVLGSGFFLSSDGYIATANHVVEDRDTVSISLADGQCYSAIKVGGDAMTDLAVLKIETDNLPFLEFGASHQLLTGETVIAIGTADSADYAGTLCSGEISHASRTVKLRKETDGTLSKKMKLIQTNITGTRGTSGSPLLNEYGQVVGIVTELDGIDSSAIGFAIPSDAALPILQAMIRGQTLTDDLISLVTTFAPHLGIIGQQEITESICGVKIVGFSDPDASAALILRKDDLILCIDRREIRSNADIKQAIAEKNVGDSVQVTVLRSEQTLTFDILLAK